MDEWKEFSGKTVDEALTAALLTFKTTSDKLEYEVIEKESKGILGIFSKPAKIRAKQKFCIDGIAKKFLDKVFKAMGIDASAEVNYDKDGENVSINIIGDDMGVLIGKRGQTLDSLQYLTSLVVNKNNDGYLKVKLDTENYRERRKETLENLAKNIASKVKRTRKAVSLEPMNPYERRIIHSALQNDKYVETHSEGEEPFRKVVVSVKKGVTYHSSNSTSTSSNGNTFSNASSTSNNNGGNSNSRSNSNNFNGSNISNSSKYNNKDFAKRSFNKDNKKEFQKKYGVDTKDYSTDYKKDYAAYLEAKAVAKAVELEKEENA